MFRTTGHERAVNTLKRGIAEGRLSHAFLFAGPPQIGKITLATDLAKAVNCLAEDMPARPCGECRQCRRIERGSHADVRIVRLIKDESTGKMKTMVGIEQVLEIQKEASLKPFEGRYRVFIFECADRLSLDAANALLKTLEEPPDQVIIILLAPESALMLPTVLSRCQTLELRPVPVPAITEQLVGRFNVDAGRAEEIARLSDGRPGWAIEAATRPEMLQEIAARIETAEKLMGASLSERFEIAADLATVFTRDREAGRKDVATWMEWWRDVLLVKGGAGAHVKHISRMNSLSAVASGMTIEQIAAVVNALQQTAGLMERNVNARLALEGLMLAMPKIRLAA
ncbi:MAG: DNA polymerase III subunit delta' [SAR202 cluster bacterium]|nr:DNA polymerase III subunit delta' [SAR202 cluster bacterium]